LVSHVRCSSVDALKDILARPVLWCFDLAEASSPFSRTGVLGYNIWRNESGGIIASARCPV
jgi:hypothetical protein